MKYRNDLPNDKFECAYFSVAEPFEVFVLVGHSESGTFVGRSRMLGNVYERRMLQPGDEIHDLFGGVFAIIGGEAFAAKARLSEKHPFEWQGTAFEAGWPVGKLNSLFPGSETKPAGGYSRTLPTLPMGKPVGRGIDSVREAP